MAQPIAAPPQAHDVTASPADNWSDSYYRTSDSGPKQPVTADTLSSPNLVDTLYELALNGITAERFRHVRGCFYAQRPWACLRRLTIDLAVGDRGDRGPHFTLSKYHFPELHTLRLRGIHLCDDTSLDKLTKLRLRNPWTPAGSNPDGFLQMLKRSASTLRTLELRDCLPESPCIGAYTPDQRFNEIGLPQIQKLRVEADDLQRLRYFFHNIALPALASVTVAFPRGKRNRHTIRTDPDGHETQPCPDGHATQLYLDDPFWQEVSKVSLQILSGHDSSLPKSSLSGPGRLVYIMRPARSTDGDRWLAPDSDDIGAACPLYPQSLKEVEVIADWSDSATVDAIWVWLKNIKPLELFIIRNIEQSGRAVQLAERLDLLLHNTASEVIFPQLQHIHIDNVCLEDNEGEELRRKMVQYVAWRAERRHGLRAVTINGVSLDECHDLDQPPRPVYRSVP